MEAKPAQQNIRIPSSTRHERNGTTLLSSGQRRESCGPYPIVRQVLVVLETSNQSSSSSSMRFRLSSFHAQPTAIWNRSRQRYRPLGRRRSRSPASGTEG